MASPPRRTPAPRAKTPKEKMYDRLLNEIEYKIRGLPPPPKKNTYWSFFQFHREDEQEKPDKKLEALKQLRKLVEEEYGSGGETLEDHKISLQQHVTHAFYKFLKPASPDDAKDLFGEIMSCIDQDVHKEFEKYSKQLSKQLKVYLDACSTAIKPPPPPLAAYSFVPSSRATSDEEIIDPSCTGTLGTT